MGQEESSNTQLNDNSIYDSICLVNQKLSHIPEPFLNPNFAQITQLNLSQNSIKTLPIGFVNLRILSLSENGLKSISSKIKRAILSYTKLEAIDLSFNSLVEIPIEILSMESLRRINAFSNKLCVLDVSSSFLTSLDCGQNWFQEPPICSPYLQFLNLDMNFIKTVDMPIKNFIRASFRLNQISAISPTIVFPSLILLDIGYNQIKKLPDISKLAPELKVLDASYNKITGFPTLPKSIKEVYFQGNKIQEIPNDLSKYSQLAILNLADNQIRKIPKLPSKIQELNLENNLIEKFEQSRLTKLTILKVNKNHIIEIPDLNSPVKEFNFISNKFVHLTVSSLSDVVTRLDLTNNMIEELPENLFDSLILPNLLHVILARNKIKALPKTFHKSMIITFNISCNPLEKLPDQFPETIEHISVAHCNLSQLPMCLGHSSELVELDASGNNLSEIPIMQELTMLHLSLNNFKEFPVVSSKLISLDLSCNKLKIIPNNISLNRLIDANFSYNEINEFPTTFSAPKLHTLKLAHNPISSFIDISRFPNLSQINVTETKIQFSNLNIEEGQIVIEISDGLLFVNPSTRLIQCDEWCAISRNKGLRESIEDAFIIRTLLQNNIDLFGIWDSHFGGKSASFGAFELTNYIQEQPFSFSEEYLTKYCDKMTEILDSRSFNDGSAMGLCICSNNQLLTANCGNITIFIIGNHGNDIDIIENTSIVENEIYFERAESASSGPQNKFSGIDVPTHFVVSTRTLKPTDEWIIIASFGVLNILSAEEIGKISATTESARELSFKITTIVRSCYCNDNASVIAYNIKQSPSFLKA